MNEPIPTPTEPQVPSPEEVARSRMNAPYPRRFVTGAEVQEKLRALEAENSRNPEFGAAELQPFLQRYRSARPVHYRLADGTVVTFMPDESA